MYKIQIFIYNDNNNIIMLQYQEKYSTLMSLLLESNMAFLARKIYSKSYYYY